MKIAYLIPWGCILSGKSNGVRMQAEGWADELRKLGHEVILIDLWGNYDWSSFEVIHIFGYWQGIDDFIRLLKTRSRAAVAISPIIDTNRPSWITRLAGMVKFSALHMISPTATMLAVEQLKPFYFSRSQYEANYIAKLFRCPQARIFNVPLSFRLQAPKIISAERENYCIHVSILSGPHKNVKCLIQAAIEHNFELRLAGKYGTEEFRLYLEQVTKKFPNIHYLGWLSDNEMQDLFAHAKCFALPSVFEGVGLVALDAAVNGCDIVITDRGGPKEYYNGMAQLVNPESVTDIGEKIVRVLQGATHQPELGRYIQEKYSPRAMAQTLAQNYQTMKNL